MSIKEIMKIGTNGMTTAEKQEEQERRIQVSERINLLQVRILGYEQESKKVASGSAEAKELKAKIRKYNREMSRIKGSESEWLKQAAWFLYV